MASKFARPRPRINMRQVQMTDQHQSARVCTDRAQRWQAADGSIRRSCRRQMARCSPRLEWTDRGEPATRPYYELTYDRIKLVLPRADPDRGGTLRTLLNLRGRQQRQIDDSLSTSLIAGDERRGQRLVWCRVGVRRKPAAAVAPAAAASALRLSRTGTGAVHGAECPWATPTAVRSHTVCNLDSTKLRVRAAQRRKPVGSRERRRRGLAGRRCCCCCGR